MTIEEKPKVLHKLYTETLYYNIKLTEKYARAFAFQIFEKHNAPINPDELMVLDIINSQPDICQRDLAKLIFKDRANTGRLLENLENKKLIIRTDDTKNNRPVKKIHLTEEGKILLNELTEKIVPIFNQLAEILSKEEIDIVKNIMKKLRDGYNEIIEIQI